MKKLIILGLLIFILSIGCVSAQDNDNISSSDVIQINESNYGTTIAPHSDDSNNIYENSQSDLSTNNASTIISAPDIEKYYGGPERFVVNLTDSAGNPITDEKIKITLNENEYERTTDINGSASLSINLPAGIYKTDVEYGDEKITSTVTVKTTLEGKNLTKIFRNSSQYSVTVKNSNGSLLNNMEVEFNINGVFYKRTTNTRGMAKLNINLNPGTYIITAKNPANNEQRSDTITVLSNIIENRNITKYYKNETQYTIQLLDGQGNPAGAGESVEFNINGIFYTRYSDDSGHVKMNINLNPGEYIITADYNGLKISNKITVISILEGNDVNMEYMDGSKYEVKLLDGQGNPYPNQNISLNINGVLYQRTTDENGTAKLNINLNPNTYIITASYNGLSISNNIAVDNSVNTYDCSNGHELVLPKSAKVNVSENIYEINYKDGIAVFNFEEWDENLDLSDFIMMNYDVYATTLEDYNGWTVLELDFDENEAPSYELLNCDKYIYIIDSGDLNIAKRVANSFH